MTKVYIDPSLQSEYEGKSKIAGALFAVIGAINLVVTLFSIFDVLVSLFLFFTAYGLLTRSEWGSRYGKVFGIIAIIYSIFKLIGLVSIIIFGAQFMPYFSQMILWLWIGAVLVIVQTAMIFPALLITLRIRDIQQESAAKSPGVGDVSGRGNCPRCGAAQIKFVDGVTWECRNCGHKYQ